MKYNNLANFLLFSYLPVTIYNILQSYKINYYKISQLRFGITNAFRCCCFLYFCNNIDCAVVIILLLLAGSGC